MINIVRQKIQYRSVSPQWPLLVARFLAIVAVITFPFAVMMPFIRVDPSLSDPFLEAVVQWLTGESFAVRRYSVLRGIVLLFEEGQVGVAFVLLSFSVFFPVVKLALLVQLVFGKKKFEESKTRWLEKLGPWSMLDVFVASLTIVSFLVFPGGTRITPEIGYFLFLGSIVAGMAATLLTGAYSKGESERDSKS